MLQFHPDLTRLTNKMLFELADKNPRDVELLERIHNELLTRTSLSAVAARPHVAGLIEQATGRPKPIARKRSTYWKYAAAIAGFLVIGISHAVGQSIWETVWPRVQTLFF